METPKLRLKSQVIAEYHQKCQELGQIEAQRHLAKLRMAQLLDEVAKLNQEPCTLDEANSASEAQAT